MKTSIAMRKSLVSATVFMSLSAISAMAYADADSYGELQFDAFTIGDVIRRELATQSDFCPVEVSSGNQTVLADHLELTNAGTLSRGTAESIVAINSFFSVGSSAVLYTQPVGVHLKTIECAKDPSCTTTNVVLASLTYEIYTDTSGSLCLTSHSANNLPDGLSPPGVDVCLPFDTVAAMRAAGLQGAAISGSAVSLSSDSSRLAVRIELGRTAADYDSARMTAWEQFAMGAIEGEAATGDWSVFVHKSLILGALKGRLAQALASHNGLTITEPMEASWAGLGEDGATVTVQTSGALSSIVCPNNIQVNDILLSAAVKPNLGTNGPNGLLMLGNVSYDVSNEDAALCGLALGGSLGELVLGSVADSITLPLELGPDCTSSSDFQFECGQITHPQYASVGPLQIARSELTSILGTTSGLVMNGIVNISGNATLTMTGDAPAFIYDEFAEAHTSTFRAGGTGKLCGVTFSAGGGGNLGLFTITAPSIPALPYTVTLPASNAEAYATSPFPLRAMVKTSAGVRTYELPEVEVDPLM